MIWLKRNPLWLALGLIVAVNAVVLGGVAYNRNGAPDSELALNERELRIPYHWRGNTENSGLSLNLNWRMPEAENGPRAMRYYGVRSDADWLDAAKLQSLGFKLAPVTADSSRRGWREQSRLAFVVLEFDGPEYRKALEQARRLAADAAAAARAAPLNRELAERAKKTAEDLASEATNSRLFAIDAALDRAALRARYPDRTRYAIVRAKVRAYSNSYNRSQDWRGSLQLLNDEIHLPLQYKKLVQAGPRIYPPQGEPEATGKFRARVAFGQRLEPWLLSVDAVK